LPVPFARVTAFGNPEVQTVTDRQGRFGFVAEDLQGLGLVSSSLSVLARAPGLAGLSQPKSAGLNGVTDVGTLRLNFAGGIVGRLQRSTSAATRELPSEAVRLIAKGEGSEKPLVVGQNHVGGIFGSLEATNARELWAHGDVRGNYRVGGIVGWSWRVPVIERCQVESAVLGTAGSVGGIVGEYYMSREEVVRSCLMLGSVSGKTAVIGNHGAIDYQVHGVGGVFGTHRTDREGVDKRYSPDDGCQTSIVEAAVRVDASSPQPLTPAGVVGGALYSTAGQNTWHLDLNRKEVQGIVGVFPSDTCFFNSDIDLTSYVHFIKASWLAGSIENLPNATYINVYNTFDFIGTWVWDETVKRPRLQWLEAYKATQGN
jgi:hypothetical protein